MNNHESITQKHIFVLKNVSMERVNIPMSTEIVSVMDSSYV